MITREKIKEGEGKLKSFDSEIGHATRRNKTKNENVHTQNDKAFHKDLFSMEDMINTLFLDYKNRIEKKEKKKK